MLHKSFVTFGNSIEHYYKKKVLQDKTVIAELQAENKKLQEELKTFMAEMTMYKKSTHEDITKLKSQIK